MGTKIKTFALLAVVLFLLGTTLYISFMLRNETDTAPTTIQKTKAAAQTYGKTLTINTPVPTATNTPTPMSEVVAKSDKQVGAAAVGITVTPSPTSVLIASAGTTLTGTPTPTEVIIAQVSPTASATVSATATPTKSTKLPDAGWIKPSHLLFLFAFSLIFFSLIY